MNIKYIIEYNDDESFISKREVRSYDEKEHIFDTFNDAKNYLLDSFQFKISEYEKSIDFLVCTNEIDYF